MQNDAIVCCTWASNHISLLISLFHLSCTQTCWIGLSFPLNHSKTFLFYSFSSPNSFFLSLKLFLALLGVHTHTTHYTLNWKYWKLLLIYFIQFDKSVNERLSAVARKKTNEGLNEWMNKTDTFSGKHHFIMCLYTSKDELYTIKVNG